MLECEIVGRDLRTGEPVPLEQPEWVVTSSSSCPCRNLFKVERHLRPAFEQTETALPAAICLFGHAIKKQTLMEWRIAGSPLHGKWLQSGDVSVMSEGTPVWANHFGRTDITFVSFSTDLFTTAAGDSIPRGHVELHKGTPAALVTYETASEKITLLVTSSKSAVVAGGDEVRFGTLGFHYRTASVIAWSNHGLLYALFGVVHRQATAESKVGILFSRLDGNALGLRKQF